MRGRRCLTRRSERFPCRNSVHAKCGGQSCQNRREQDLFRRQLLLEVSAYALLLGAAVHAHSALP